MKRPAIHVLRSRRPARGQSAVETMFMIPVLILVFLGMYELFTLTFATQNAHIRARESVLHNGYYTPATPSGESSMKNGSVFKVQSGQPNYIIADKDIWGLASVPSGGSKGWYAQAHDRAIPGIARGTSDKGNYIKTTAYICSPVGCPPVP